MSHAQLELEGGGFRTAFVSIDGIFGHRAHVQRCRTNMLRNALERLPKEQCTQTKAVMKAAFKLEAKAAWTSQRRCGRGRLVELGAAEAAGRHADTYAPIDPRVFLERQAGELRDCCHALSAALSQRIQRARRGPIRTAGGLADCDGQLRTEIGRARATCG
jgi:hypothetical protein